MRDNIGYFLYMRRVAKGITREYIADKLDTTVEVVAKWENGSIKPDEYTILRLNEILESEEIAHEEMASVEVNAEPPSSEVQQEYTESALSEYQADNTTPSSSTVKKTLFAIFGAVFLILFCAATLMLTTKERTTQKVMETEEYNVAFRYLKTSQTLKTYKGAEIKFKKYNTDFLFQNTRITFSVGSDEITVTCHRYEDGWEACEECSKLNEPKKLTLPEKNKLRPDYKYGACKNLEGDVAVVMIYVDDFESTWTVEEMKNFTENEVQPALDFLEREAADYGIDLNISVQGTYSAYYSGEVIRSMKRANGKSTEDVLEKVAGQIGHSSDEAMLKVFRKNFDTDEVICITVFNKDGTGVALNPQKPQTDLYDPITNVGLQEHVVMFSRDIDETEMGPAGSQSATVVEYILYLYGTEALYKDDFRITYASYHCPTDLMYTVAPDIFDLDIEDVTAFYIGWTDDPPLTMQDERW